jgi:glycine/D-amino acid oxidase-like deaminating enzyme
MQNQLSYWEKKTFLRKADVIIIGGGIVGINAAITLKENSPQKNIIVLERGLLPTGASTRNAGFACFGSMTELIADLKQQSQNEVFTLVERRWRGLQRLRERVGDKRMDYKAFGAYELFRSQDQSTFEDCQSKIDAFNTVLAEITGESEVFQIRSEAIQSFGFSGVKDLITNQLEGQLHPGKMMQTLWGYARSLGVDIITGVNVSQVESGNSGVDLFSTNGVMFRSKKVLLATNGFTRRLYPSLVVLPARNQVLITKPLENLPFRGCFHYDEGYYYFRNVGDRVLLGGGRHLAKAAEQTDQFGCTDLIQDALRTLLSQTILPNTTFEIDQWWSGILGVGEQKTPIIQEMDKHIFVAVRLGGMGVAIGSLVGQDAAQMIENT